jgi:hypothetical protein
MLAGGEGAVVPDCDGADVVAIGVVGDVLGEVGLAGLEVAAGWPGVVVAQPAASHDAVTSATAGHVIRRARPDATPANARRSRLDPLVATALIAAMRARARGNMDMACSFRADRFAGAITVSRRHADSRP